MIYGLIACLNCKIEFRAKWLIFKPRYCSKECKKLHRIKLNIRIVANNLDFDKDK